MLAAAMMCWNEAVVVLFEGTTTASTELGREISRC